MRRALIYLNLYGCEAVRHKGKNSLKTQILHFLPVFALMSDSLTAIKVEINQCPLHQSILLTQGPIHEIFIKKYWELTKPWKWLLFSFLVFGFWLLGCSKKIFFGFSVWKKPRSFIWGSIYSCTMDGFFTIFKKAVSELICTRLYVFEFFRLGSVLEWQVCIRLW